MRRQLGGKKLSPEVLEESEYQHVSIRHEGSEKITTEDFIRNNETRATRGHVCAPIEKFSGSLEAIKNEDGQAKGIQIHDIFWGLSGELGASRSRRNGLGRTVLLFAIYFKHPALVLKLKGVSEKWKTLWTRWEFAPWAPCISYR